MSVFLGLDTSAYTTSLALMVEGEMNKREKMLEVKKGEKGLRQSEAVFQHQNNLPFLFETLFNSPREIGKKDIKAVGASVSPRPVSGSYMPVFTVGSAFGRVIARVLDVDFFPTTHQENHLACGLYSNDILLEKFLAFHVSGGTTELLDVKYDPNKCEFITDIVGGTQDLSAGQFIDRVGVMLGCEFPAGKELEEMANKADEASQVPIAVKGCNISFSGPLTYVQRKIEEDKSKGNLNSGSIALGVFRSVAFSLEKLIFNALSSKQKFKDILFVGGVMSNTHIKNYLETELKLKFDLNTWFTPPELSKDNGAGVAWITAQKYFTGF